MDEQNVLGIFSATTAATINSCGTLTPGRPGRSGRNEAWLGVRLSQADHAAIQLRAKAAGLTMSEYVRRRCTTDPDGPIIRVDANELRMLLVDLKRAGNLLNQVARALNQGHAPAGIEQAFQELSQATHALSEFISDARRSA